MARENFYLILELPLDPPEEDPAVIERTIERKRLEWSRQASDFKKGPVYRAYTALLPSIREVMADENKRRREYEEAYRITYEKARHMLAIIEKRGYLYESEIKNISERVSGNEGIVRKACRVRIVEDGEVGTDEHKKPEGADRFLVFQVYLDTLNKKDYYDFINYHGTMSARLSDMPTYRLLELVKNLKITYARNTPEESAVEKLCAECEKTFATKESKAQYDAYLVWKMTEEIFLQVQVATELTKVLELSQADEARKLLLQVVRDPERSEALLRGYCRQNGIAMEQPPVKERQQAAGRQMAGTRQSSGMRMGNRRMQQAHMISNPQQQNMESAYEEKEEVREVQPMMAINLKVMVDTVKRCNYISWEKTTMDPAVNYLIVRKRGAAPSTINDGELLGTVSVNTYTDGSVYPGKLYYYAVFAVKRGVYSKGVTTKVGYLNLFEVENVTIECRQGKVVITWTQNYKECRVAIFKQEGNAPMEFGEGRLCYNASQMCFTDGEVKKEHTYYYRIYTTINVNGKRFHSKGTIVSIQVPLEKRKMPEQKQEEKQQIKQETKKEQKEEKQEVPFLSRKPAELGLHSPVAVKKKEEESFLPKMKPSSYMEPEPRVADDHQILYDIKVRKGIFKAKGVELIVTSKMEQFELPAMLIVAQKDFPPAHKESGVLIGTIEKQPVKGKYSHEISYAQIRGLDYIKLFLANEADHGRYELHLRYGSSSKFT